jgi:hypothetical protein
MRTPTTTIQTEPTAALPAAPGLADLAPFNHFARECEIANLATKPQLRWWLRFRSENGLVTVH